MKCIVTAVSWQQQPNVDYPFPAIRRHVHQFNSNKVELSTMADYYRAVKGIDTLFCDEEDVPGVVDAMSLHFPNQEISVYKLDSISVRAPGELKNKAITKDGVLPT